MDKLDKYLHLFKEAQVAKDLFNFSYNDLIKLHELWYKINQLETKLSGRADDIKNRLIGEFYDLSQKIIAIFQEVFRLWIKAHWESPIDKYAPKVLQHVDQVLNKLYGLKGSTNINEIMSILSLALNVMHFNGKMFEKFLSDEQFEQLSNLDVSQWDQELKHVAQRKPNDYPSNRPTSPNTHDKSDILNPNEFRNDVLTTDDSGYDGHPENLTGNPGVQNPEEDIHNYNNEAKPSHYPYDADMLENNTQKPEPLGFNEKQINHPWLIYLEEADELNHNIAMKMKALGIKYVHRDMFMKNLEKYNES